MKKILRRVTFSFGLILVVATLILAFLAFFANTYDDVTGEKIDIFGRGLSKPPLWGRIIFWFGSEWPGPIWHAVDIILFFGGLILGGWLINSGLNKRDGKERKNIVDI